jgi:hypothetical protein
METSYGRRGIDMGRNFYSVCHECKVKLFHFRGKEGDYMQPFQSVHGDHEKMTEIYNDYVEEPPESYTDLDNPTPEPDVVRAKLSGNDLVKSDPEAPMSSNNPPKSPPLDIDTILYELLDTLTTNVQDRIKGRQLIDKAVRTAELRAVITELKAWASKSNASLHELFNDRIKELEQEQQP